MKNSNIIMLGILALAIFIGSNTLYVVREVDRAVLLTFGEVTNADIPPGLHFRIPGVHVPRIFDGRVQTLDADTQSYLTAEREFLEVDSYAKWRIHDVATYYTRTSGDINIANNLLAQRINTNLRNQIASRSVREVVSGQRDSLMEDITFRLNQVAQAELGIEILDVRVKQIELPDGVREAVYNRMNTERQQEAAEARSTGRELAEIIRAEADRQQIVIEANAYRDAEIIRGDGDAQSTAIYATAFSQDPAFYEFTRSLSAYRETFKDSSDLMILSPNNEFFKYLLSSSGRVVQEQQ
jgi:modulator of FtsH protease HflC